MNPRLLAYKATETNEVVAIPPSLQGKTNDELLTGYSDFAAVDLNLQPETVKTHIALLRVFAKAVEGLGNVSSEDLREFLKGVDNSNTKSGYIKAFRRFYRDYLGCGGLVSTFRLPAPSEPTVKEPSREELAEIAGYRLPYKAFYLALASSGMRLKEALTVTRDRYNSETRMLDLKGLHKGETKRSCVTFLNEEAAAALEQYLKTRNDNSPLLFNIREGGYNRFKRTNSLTGKQLRVWFCNEMGRKGIQDRYVDAFCGRLPRSVLARHYTVYEPEQLKQIYDRARLKVLTE